MVDHLQYLDLSSTQSTHRGERVSSKSLIMAAESGGSMISTQGETILETVLEDAEEESSLPFEDDAQSERIERT